MSDFKDVENAHITGHIRMFYPDTQEVIVDKYNQIHFENMSEALANSIANRSNGFVHEMHFGNGGTSVDPTGIISYLPPNTVGQTSDLYNQTYYKVIDDTSILNTDPTRNKITVRHIPGQRFTDILISCLLDYGEPNGQTAFDNSENLDGLFVFDELGLKSWEGEAGMGKLLTHVVFHPVQKSLNRLIQIDYTVRIQTITAISTGG
jgi:hypothetical protein